jgi:hypothetical protein
MLLLHSDPSDPYVPFVTSRHGSAHIHEVRRHESRVSRPRRLIGRALVRAGLVMAGLDASSR